ncbi:hypothetical protein ACFQJC_14455 [Haloferax namakaokahaiae]|uniref:Uncharacterized protein n=1 Tax=Haloferax namakaokahaiae TaxID=1748331 RepID=A0ABD5ZHM0_9EURY
MPSETNAKVEKMTSVQDAQGVAQPPASDAEGYVSSDGVDISTSGSKTVTPDVPGRATQMFILVEADAAFKVELVLPDSGITRGPNQNSDFASSDGSQVAQVVAVYSPTVQVKISDTSGGANTAKYDVRVV